MNLDDPGTNSTAGGYERVCAHVDISAVEHNFASMKRVLRAGTKICAVIKADGYGHGALPIAEKLEGEEYDYIWGFAVATFEEAMKLRTGGIIKPIIILGYVFPYCYEQLSLYDIRPALFRQDMLKQLSEAASKTGRKLKVHLAVDTGMSRIGTSCDEDGVDFALKALNTPNVEVEGIFTHFARADEADERPTRLQLEKFTGFVSRIENRSGRRIPIRHCSNSAGIISFPDANMDMVRSGITQYGLWPSREVPRDIVGLKAAMSLISHIVYIKDVPEGTPVSYGGTFATAAGTKIATIPVGYADGYPRSLSNKGYVLIHGRRAPIIGRICMDQFMVDITGMDDVRTGDRVTLLGEDGEERISAEELGELSGRFNYELVCGISPRVPRQYHLKPIESH